VVKSLGSAGAAVLLLASACKPNLNDTVSVVDSPQILAARVGAAGGQAEWAPMATTEFTALYVGASGAISPSTVNWAICNERKPLAELEPVSPFCLNATGSWFTPLGTSNPASGTIPIDACSQFGPDVPQPMAGQPPGRPVDPDVTGGFYLPVRAIAPGASSDLTVIAETRLLCDLAGATPDVAAAFKQRYHPNTNPVVASLVVEGDAGPWTAMAPGAGPNVVKAGAHLDLEVAWPACPLTDVAGDGVCGPDETGEACSTCGAGVGVSMSDCCPGPMKDCTQPSGCQGAERYALFDSSSGRLVDAREGISIAWFATGGSFDSDSTGRVGTDPATTSDNGWTAPTQPGSIVLWVVLRDDRSGVGWQTYSVDVK
jgi:hypothetical protein